MPKSKHRRNGQTRPRTPQPKNQQVNMAALFEKMYEGKLLELNALRGELQRTQATLAATVLATGGTEVVLTPDALAMLADVTGLTQYEDGDGNPVVVVMLDGEEE